MKKIITICAFIACVIPSCSFSQSRLTEVEKAKELYKLNKSLVESKNFSFIATWVIGEDKRSEVAENENTITINGSSIYGPLSTLEADKPTMLKGSLENYTVNFNDETRVIKVNFKIGAYTAKIEVKPTGNAFLELKNINTGKQLIYKGGIK